MKSKLKNLKLWIFATIGIAIGIPVILFLAGKLEGEKPVIEAEFEYPSLGISQEVTFKITDKKSGIRRVWIEILKDGKDKVLIKEEFSGTSFFSKGNITEKTLKINIEPKELGIKDGTAILRMVVWDYSWRGLFKGNLTYIEKEIEIDTTPPTIDVISKVHNLTQGGTGLVIYKVPEICIKNGIIVGDNYFPGYPGYFNDQDIYMALFAVSHDQSTKTNIHIEVVDQAGNKKKSGFRFHIRSKKFKRDIINIPDKFLTWKVPEFENEIELSPDSSIIDKYLFINRNIRKSNFDTIVSHIGNSVNKFLWEGKFVRLPNSARRAAFADQREYRYKGKKIDNQVHLGVDLASVKHADVPAANTGKVVYAEPLGIYGKTVIIDHGFSLFTMYSHLSSINVEIGRIAKKNDIIGKTGTTGLAGGDHLHFSFLVHNTFVNPLEFWDSQWIKNNITMKIEIANAF